MVDSMPRANLVESSMKRYDEHIKISHIREARIRNPRVRENRTAFWRVVVRADDQRKTSPYRGK